MTARPTSLGDAPSQAQDCAISIIFDAEDVHALAEAKALESSVHAADRVDLSGYAVAESAGSKAGQKLQAVGNKLIDNEGQVQVPMTAPVGPAHTSL